MFSDLAMVSYTLQSLSICSNYYTP